MEPEVTCSNSFDSPLRQWTEWEVKEVVFFFPFLFYFCFLVEGSFFFLFMSCFFSFGSSFLMPAPLSLSFSLGAQFSYPGCSEHPLPKVASSLWTSLPVHGPGANSPPILWFFPSVSADSASSSWGTQFSVCSSVAPSHKKCRLTIEAT